MSLAIRPRLRGRSRRFLLRHLRRLRGRWQSHGLGGRRSRWWWRCRPRCEWKRRNRERRSAGCSTSCTCQSTRPLLPWFASCQKIAVIASHRLDECGVEQDMYLEQVSATAHSMADPGSWPTLEAAVVGPLPKSRVLSLQPTIQIRIASHAQAVGCASFSHVHAVVLRTDVHTA